MRMHRPIPALALAASFLLAGRTAAATPPAVSWGATTEIDRGGWGRLARDADGWFAVCTRFAGRESMLRIYAANPDTGNWTMVGEVAEPGRLLDNGNLIALPGGTLLLTGRSLVKGASYHLPVWRSIDRGRTWTVLSTIDRSEGPPGTMDGRGLWEPHFYQLPGGRLAVAYANEKPAAAKPSYSQVCTVKVSPDHGRTWGPEIELAAEPGGGKLRPGMPVVTRMQDGRFIAVFEVVGIGDADIFMKISPDGTKWPTGLGTAIPGHHAGPWVVSLDDGTLLLTSCSNTLSRSTDHGASWHAYGPPPFEIGPGKKFTWPAIYPTGPGRLAAIVSWRGVRVRLGTLGPEMPKR